VLVTDNTNSIIYNVPPGGVVTTFASTNIDEPLGIVTNPTTGNVYVANNGTTAALINSVSVFDTNGTFLTSFGGSHLNAPTGLALDPTGNVYVANADGSIAKYDAAGAFITSVSTNLASPYGMVVAGTTLYVADQVGNKVEKFDITTLADQGTFVSGAAVDGPSGLAIGPNGNLFVTNFSTAAVTPVDTITEYTLGGTFIGTYANSFTIASMAGPIGILFGSTSNQAYVVNNIDGNISLIGPPGAGFGTDNGILASGLGGAAFIAPHVRPVPEPASIGLISLGLAGSLLYTRRRKTTRKVSA